MPPSRWISNPCARPRPPGCHSSPRARPPSGSNGGGGERPPSLSSLSCGGGVGVGVGVGIGGRGDGGSGSGWDRDAEKPSSSAHRRRCPSSLHPRIRRARCPVDRLTPPPGPAPPGLKTSRFRMIPPSSGSCRDGRGDGGAVPASASPCARTTSSCPSTSTLGECSWRCASTRGTWEEVWENDSEQRKDGGDGRRR